jgi:ornithine cyclodeaminase
MLWLSADRVHAALDYPGLVAALRRAHLGPMPEAAHMVRDEPGGGANRFVALVGWQQGGIIAVKLVGVFPDNLARRPPEPSVQGIVAVFDGATGAPVLAADGAAMTFRKTAADSALASDILARRDARVLLVVGAGGLAPHVLAAHRAVRPGIARVLVWNRSPERAAALVRAHAGGDFAIDVAPDLDAAVAEADIVTCVTMSDRPLVRGACLRPGAHLDLIGAYLPTMREADDAAMARGTVFVDTRSGMEGAGDLAGPVAAGAIGWDAVQADLFALCQGRHPGRRSDAEVTVFKNVGGGHLDLFTAATLLDKLRRGSL